MQTERSSDLVLCQKWHIFPQGRDILAHFLQEKEGFSAETPFGMASATLVAQTSKQKLSQEEKT